MLHQLSVPSSSSLHQLQSYNLVEVEKRRRRALRRFEALRSEMLTEITGELPALQAALLGQNKANKVIKLTYPALIPGLPQTPGEIGFSDTPNLKVGGLPFLRQAG